MNITILNVLCDLPEITPYVTGQPIQQSNMRLDTVYMLVPVGPSAAQLLCLAIPVTTMPLRQLDLAISTG